MVFDRSLMHLVHSADEDMCTITLSCDGDHGHPHPPPARASPEAIRQFKTRVLQAPTAATKSLLVGSRSASSVAKIHTKFANLDYASYVRRRALEETKLPYTPDSMLNWQQESADQKSFVRESSFNADSGYAFLAADWMIDLLKGFTAPMSSDALEGLIKQPANASLLVTVAYSSVLNRVVPMAMSIILGKSAEHYKRHFAALFDAMQLDVSAEGLPVWDGMVADFPQLKPRRSRSVSRLTSIPNAMTFI
jgi:hypothetical protein